MPAFSRYMSTLCHNVILITSPLFCSVVWVYSVCSYSYCLLSFVVADFLSSSRSMPSMFGYGLCSLCSGFLSVVVGLSRFGFSVFFFVGLDGIVYPVLA